MSWLAVAVATLSGCAGPTDEPSQVVTSAVGSPLCDPAILGGAEIAAGVKYYDCTARLLFDVRANIVTIDRSLPATEIRLLTDPDAQVVSGPGDIEAVGHRVVHGGERFARSVLITPEVARIICRTP